MAYSAFEDTGTTARSKGMGSAIFADFDAVNSMNYNPAVIALARSIQFYADYDNPYFGLNDQTVINTFNVNIVIPFWNRFTIPIDEFFTKRAALGISVHRMSLGGTDSDGSSVEFYHEGVYSLFYAKDLNDIISKGAKLSVGVKMSLFDQGVGNSIDVQNNPNIGQQNNFSFGMDIGATYDFSETIHIGVAYRNLVQPSESILAGGTDKVPSELRIGGNWDIGDFLYIFKKSKLGFGMVSFGRDPNDNRQADSTWNLGFEFKQLTAGDLFKGSEYKDELLSVRLGTIYEARKIGDTVDLGFTKLQGGFDITGGLGFSYILAQYHKLTLDYCIQYAFQFGALSQSVGLNYEFIFPSSYFAYKEETRKEMEFEEMMKVRAQNQAQSNTNVQQSNLPNKQTEPPANGKKTPAK